MNGSDDHPTGFDDLTADQDSYYDELAAEYDEWTQSFSEREGYDDLTSAWDAEWWQANQIIAGSVSAGKRIAVIGCGSSRLDYGDNVAQIVFTDKSWNMLQRSKLANQSPRASFVRGAAEALPFHDNYFDVAICTQLLSHLPDSNLRLAISGLCRIISRGGRVIVTDSMSPFPSGSPKIGDFQVRLLHGKKFRLYKRYRVPEDLTCLFPPGDIKGWRGQRFLFSFQWKKR